MVIYIYPSKFYFPERNNSHQVLTENLNYQYYDPDQTPAQLQSDDLVLYTQFLDLTARTLENAVQLTPTILQKVINNPRPNRLEKIELNPILKQILSLPQGYLFLFNSWENLPLKSTLFRQNFYLLLEHQQIPANKVIISASDSSLIGQQLQIDETIQTKEVKVFGFDWAFLRERKDRAVSQNVGFGYPRKKTFIFLNRRFTYDRWVVYSYLMSKSYDQKGFLSFLSAGQALSQVDQAFFDCQLTPADQQRILKSVPRELDGGYHQVDWALNSGIQDYLREVYFLIIHETWCHRTDVIFNSEKSYKAMKLGLPFLLFGPAGNYAHLHRLGFRTFSPWINESWDQEPDYRQRLKLFLQEIDRLCQLDQVALMNLYRQLLPTIMYNINHIRKKEECSLLRENLQMVTRKRYPN